MLMESICKPQICSASMFSFSPDMENDVRPRVPPAIFMLVVQFLSQPPVVMLVDTACTR